MRLYYRRSLTLLGDRAVAPPIQSLSPHLPSTLYPLTSTLSLLTGTDVRGRILDCVNFIQIDKQ